MAESCDLHEMENCAFCNGSDARLKSSLMEPPTETGPVQQHAGGVTVRAQFHGTCEGCGGRIVPGDEIFRPTNSEIRWVRVYCCLGIAQE